MFEKSGEFLAENLEKYLNSILKIVQPVAIIFIGLFIGIIVVAVYLPIFNLGEALM
jgi:type IV pilus assembly protein PilC